jgi:hypothetical protein
VSAGIAVAPGERFTIRFTTVQTTGIAAVSLTEGSNIVARAMGDKVTFTTGADQLTIGNNGAQGDYEIELPQQASWVEIVVAEQRLFLKQGARVITEGPVDSRDRYTIPLTGLQD